MFCFVLVENPGSYVANYHRIEHGETHLANYVAFEDLADEKWRERERVSHAAYDIPVSLAVAFPRHSRICFNLEIKVA